MDALSRAVQSPLLPSVKNHLRSSSPISFTQPKPFHYTLQTATTEPSDGNLETSAETSLLLTDLTEAASTSLELYKRQTQTIENPTTKRLLLIFPIYLYGGISKIGIRARILIVFPYSLDLIYLMGLTIKSNKIEYIAIELFGIHLKTVGEV